MDPEIKAMAEITEALEGLDADALRRVLRWAADRYLEDESVPELTENKTVDDQSDEPNREDFEYFHDLFEATKPETGLEQVLVAAYWFQEIQGLDSLESFQLNRELKNLGHGSSNITRDLGSLADRKPTLVMQVRKDGATKQARKKYRLTREGILTVKKMLGA